MLKVLVGGQDHDVEILLKIQVKLEINYYVSVCHDNNCFFT